MTDPKIAADLANALEAAGHGGAARLLRQLAQPQQPQQQPQSGRLELTDAPAPAGLDPATAAFLAQIKQAQEKGGGWTSTPLTNDPYGRI